MGIRILTGYIVLTNGPYKAGVWNDISVFRNALKNNLGENERVKADDGHVGESPDHIQFPRSFVNPEQTEWMQARVRSKQETVNNRFKNWEIVKQVYRNDIPSHGRAFEAVIVITQLSINNGEQLFTCGYCEPLYIVENADNTVVEDNTDRNQSDTDISYNNSELQM